jgi:hypothetical protein
VTIYIGEGYKRNRNRVSVANSDPIVVKFAADVIRRYSDKKLDCSIQYHADQHIGWLCGFWGRELGVDSDSIRLQRKSNSSKLAFRKWRCKYGVMSIAVNDTVFRARLQGWIDSLKNQWLDSVRLGA